EPDIDQHFFALVSENVDDCIDDAGIHADTRLGSITGRDLQIVVFLTMSFYLKHIEFARVAKQNYPEINYPMSLTIWKTRDEHIQSVATFTGMPERTVSAAVDLMTVKSGHASYFRNEVTPFIPMLIEVAENYLLSP